MASLVLDPGSTCAHIPKLPSYMGHGGGQDIGRLVGKRPHCRAKQLCLCVCVFVDVTLCDIRAADVHSHG